MRFYDFGSPADRERLAELPSAPAGICDDQPDHLHAHGGFCVNWRPIERISK